MPTVFQRGGSLDHSLEHWWFENPLLAELWCVEQGQRTPPLPGRSKVQPTAPKCRGQFCCVTQYVQ